MGTSVETLLACSSPGSYMKMTFFNTLQEPWVHVGCQRRFIFLHNSGLKPCSQETDRDSYRSGG